jgi:hypothetical protein
MRIGSSLDSLEEPTALSLPRTNGTNGTHPPDREVNVAAARESSSVDRSIPTAKPKRGFRGLLERLTRRRQPETASAAETDAMDAAIAGGVHEITKSTNYWFDREIGVLERDARAQAADWAAKGLPRHDVARDALEVEQFVAGRCVETFRQWIDRVRVKMRDAIAHEAEGIAANTAALQAATGRIERLTSEMADIDQRVNDLRAIPKEDAGPVGFTPIMPSRVFFWTFAVLLTLVEFFANFPVFRLLLPMKPALAKAAQLVAEDSANGEWWSGIMLQLKEMALHLDALVVALVAVLVLVLFGKTLGTSARVLFALKPSDHPLAATTIRGVRRQYWAALVGCTIGLTAVLAFLFFSRGSIASVAAQRVTADSVEFQRLTNEAAKTSVANLAAVSQMSRRISEQTQTLELHRDDAAYATTVQNNNMPLLLFNIGLVLAAAMLGYLSYKHTVSDGRGEHPAIVPLRADRRTLQHEAHATVQSGRSLEALARAGIGRAEHLMSASPLAEWRAKADRLNGVIPLFRGENARLRGIDPANILAFANKPPLTLPIVEAERGFPEPADFSRLKEQFEVGRAAFAAACPRIPINLSDVKSI